MQPLIINLTHDVDRIRKTYQYLTHDVRKGRLSNLMHAFRREDPYWQIPSLMRLEDKHGVRSTFFMLEESLQPKLTSVKSWVLGTGRYRFSEARVQQAMREMLAGGWEIGLHGSFNSYRSLDLLRGEKRSLENAIGERVVGIRQHYLNLDVPQTWRLQKAAGFLYDASFGHARAIGWRDSRFHLFTDPSSEMIIVPLALMEFNVLGRGRSAEDAWAACTALLDDAERRGAVLSILWHQRVFSEDDFPGWGHLYERIIVEGKRRGAVFRTCGQLAEDYVNVRKREVGRGAGL